MDNVDEAGDEDESTEVIEEIQRTLLASCEKAFRNGVTSADIYETLMSMGMKADAEASRVDDERTMCSSESPSCWSYILTGAELLRKLIWAVFVTFVTTVGVLCAAAYFLNIYLWPLTELDETRCLLPTHPILQELTRPITNCSICQQFQINGTPVIEFVTNPSPEAFRAIAYSSKPIIIRNNSATGMSRNFNFEKLKSLFYSEPGGLNSVIDECQFLPFKSSFTDLSEVFETARSDTGVYAGTPWYIGWSNCHPGIQEKLRTLFPRPSYLPSDSENSVIDWIFVGFPGYGAAMHLDFVRRPSWQAQLSGVKKWRIKPPPECESVCGDADISFTLSSGDLLFLDTNSWYHETFIQGKELSISIGSEYD